MTRLCEVLFWLGVSWLGYVYVGYPVLLWFVGLFRSFRPDVRDSFLPKVSVLISARNEQRDIGWKIAETLKWNYPEKQLEVVVASDASEDGTDAILRSVSDSRFRFLRLDERAGKNEALNRLNELASGELLFFTDANSHIEPDCLSRVVGHFADSRVGCVTGSERTIREGEDFVVTSGTRAFLGYESLVNTLESRLGSVLVCDGSIFCIRRSLFSKLQADLANDLELPVSIGAKGWAILFDPSASSYEKATNDPREEFRRKRRICCQGTIGFWRLRDRLHGMRAWQFFSRKLLRWSGAVPLVLILLSSLWLARNPWYAIALLLETVFYGSALWGWRLAARRRAASGVSTFPFYFVMVNVAAMTGVIDAAFGKRFSVWESPANSRGSREDATQEKEQRAAGSSILRSEALSAAENTCVELQLEKKRP
jgi:cellulose synthase/poly-beta-1,6-N-acetylglucosamine synthase-like glycosyltransferase